MSTAHTQQLKEARVRRPRARPKDVIWGCLDERLAVMAESKSMEDCLAHTSRLQELMDELRRATSKEPEE